MQLGMTGVWIKMIRWRKCQEQGQGRRFMGRWLCDNSVCPFSCSRFTLKQIQVFTFSADCKPSWGGRGIRGHLKPLLYPCSETALLIKMIPVWTYAIGAGEERWGKIKNYSALKTRFRKALNSITQQRSKTALKPYIIPIPDAVLQKPGISLKESGQYLWLAAFYIHVLCTSYFSKHHEQPKAYTYPHFPDHFNNLQSVFMG